LQALGFVAETVDRDDKFGLDQPTITAIVYGISEGGEEENPPDGSETPLFGLAIGGGAGEMDAHFARLDEGGPVFLVPDSLVEALLEEYR
jgi:hypothetical protein